MKELLSTLARRYFFPLVRLLVSTMAQRARQQECCAWIDPMDAYDTASVAVADVDLSRMLSVRCDRSPRQKLLEQACKAVAILVQNGGFRLITRDLGNIDEECLRHVTLTTCFSFARVMKKFPPRWWCWPAILPPGVVLE